MANRASSANGRSTQAGSDPLPYANSAPQRNNNGIRDNRAAYSTPLLGRGWAGGAQNSRNDSVGSAYSQMNSFSWMRRAGRSRSRSSNRTGPRFAMEDPARVGGVGGEGGEGGVGGGDDDDDGASDGLPAISVAINLIKCAVGAGSFSLPHAFMMGGVWIVFLLTFVLGALSAYTVSLLSTAELRFRFRGDRNGDTSPLTYPALARHAVGGKCGLFAAVLCVGGVILTSVGVCAVYIDFITGAIAPMSGFNATLQGCNAGAACISPQTVALASSPFVIALAMLRSFKYLVFTSILGDVAVLAGIVGALAFGFIYLDGRPPLDPAQLPFSNDVSAFPQAAGSIAFLFLIHVVILPIAQSLRPSKVVRQHAAGQPYAAVAGAPTLAEREQVAEDTGRRFTRVAYASYAFIAVINAFFGATCYLIFGSDTASNVLSNLKAAHTLPGLVDAINILLCVDLLFTMPMVLAAGRELVENVALDTAFGAKHDTLTRNTVRLLLVALVYGIALGIPSFGSLLGLVGGFANSLMGFILPPIIYQSVVGWRPQDIKGGGLQGVVGFVFRMFITVMGIALMISSTYYNIKGLM